MLLPRGALLQHFCRDPGAGTVRAGSIGRDRDWIVECLFHPPEGAGGFFHGETSALWCQAKRPGPRALANADEKLGVGKDNLLLDIIRKTRVTI